MNKHVTLATANKTNEHKIMKIRFFTALVSFSNVHYTGPLVILLPNTFKLFGFPIFRF